jgi:hypothetical protein
VEGLASYFRASASPGAAAAIMRMNREIDVRHILPATPRAYAHSTPYRRACDRRGACALHGSAYPRRKAG